MKLSEYNRLEMQVKGQLARANPGIFFVIEVVRNAGIMALVLTLMDLTPLKDWSSMPRLPFIFVWALGMTFWRFKQVREQETPSR